MGSPRRQAGGDAAGPHPAPTPSPKAIAPSGAVCSRARVSEPLTLSWQENVSVFSGFRVSVTSCVWGKGSGVGPECRAGLCPESSLLGWGGCPSCRHLRPRPWGEPHPAQPHSTFLSATCPRPPVVPQCPWAPLSHPSGSPSPTCSLRPLAHEGTCGLGRRHGSRVGSGCVLLGPDGVTPGLPAWWTPRRSWRQLGQVGGGLCPLYPRACVASQTQALGSGLQGSPGSWCPEFSSPLCEPYTQDLGPGIELSPLTTLTSG